jgi:hypothetical protein
MKLIKRLGWGLVAALWIAYLTMMIHIYTTHVIGAGDYSYYFRGAERLLNGVDLYTNLDSRSYVGPPLIAQIVAPIISLSGGDFTRSSLTWLGLNVAALLGSLALLSRYLATPGQRMLLWLGTPLFISTFHSLWIGQITPILLALTVGAWVAYKENRPVWTGILLAVAVWTKFYPGLFLLYFLWKRAWRVVISAGVTTVVVVLWQMSIGPAAFIGYFTDILPELGVQGQPQLSHSNNSVLGFAQGLFSANPQVIPLIESPALLTLTRWSLTLLMLGTLVYLTARRGMKDTQPRQFDLEYALVTVTALLLGSTLGTHGMLSVLLVYVIIIRSLSSRAQRRVYALRILLSALLISVHLLVILSVLKPPSENELPALALSTPFFGMLIAWGMVVALARQSATRESAPMDSIGAAANS